MDKPCKQCDKWSNECCRISGINWKFGYPITPSRNLWDQVFTPSQIPATNCNIKSQITLERAYASLLWWYFICDGRTLCDVPVDISSPCILQKIFGTLQTGKHPNGTGGMGPWEKLICLGTSCHWLGWFSGFSMARWMFQPGPFLGGRRMDDLVALWRWGGDFNHSSLHLCWTLMDIMMVCMWFLCASIS